MWILLGTDATGETNPAGDITDLYFYNDGTYAYFRETLLGAPNTTAFTYVVYLDKPSEGVYPKDFKLIYSSTTSEIQRWNGTGWAYVEAITVTTNTSLNSIDFNVSLASMANPDIQQNTGVLFVNYVKDMSIGKQSVDLVYGSKNVDVGDVSFSADDANLHVDIHVDPNWVMQSSRLDVSQDPLTWFAPGHWPYNHLLCPPATHDSYTVPLEAIGHGDKGQTSPFGVEPEDVVHIMVHAIVTNDEQDETAYAGKFEGSCEYKVPGDRAEAFICYEVIPELPWPMPLVFIPAVVSMVYYIYKRRFKLDERQN
jgi:hypothetical protein